MEKKRPTLLIVAVVLAIVLGVFGLIAGCMGVFSAAIQSSMMGLQEQLAASDPALQAQLGPQRAMLEAQAAYQMPMMIGAFLNVIASILLIVGASLLAALKKSGVMVYAAGAIFCALVDLVNGGLGIYMSVQMQDAMAEAMQGMAQGPGQDPAVMGAAMQAGGIVGIVFALFMIAVKLVVYALGLWAARDASAQDVLS